MKKIASQSAKAVFNSRVEKKWYPLDISNTPTISSPQITDLTGLIVQGDQYNQRNGDQIRLTHIHLDWQTAVNPSAGWTGLRFLVVRSKGGALTQGQILVPHVSATPMYGAVNTANVDILYDQHSEVDPYNPVRVYKHEIDLGQSLVQYPSASTLAKKPVYLLMLSDAITLYPSNQGNLVIRYQDA